MEAAENRPSRELAIRSQGMPVVTLRREEYLCGFRNPRSQTQMRAPLVVVSDPLRQDPAQLFLTQWNHEIQTFATYCSYQTFAVGVRLGCAHRRAQLPHPKSLELFVHLGCEDRVAVPYEKAVGMFARNRSRNCCRIHSAVGCAVTLQCTIRRVPTSINRNT